MRKLAMSPIYAMGQKNKKKEEDIYEVKSIGLITPLDDGSSNDNTGKTQKGMIDGKSYTFRVSEYVGKRPKILGKINWELTYHNLDDGEWKTIPMPTKGETFILNIGGETCGRYIYIRAYINDKKNSAVLKIWKHNRFRWFDRKLFEEQLEDRIISPWEIYQAGTSLCGMACIFYLFAKEYPKAYKKFCKDLFRKGTATYNQYTAKPSKEILDKKTVKKKSNGKEVMLPEGNTGLSLVDFVTLAGIRNSEFPLYKGGDEDLLAINWTNIMIKLCEKLLGYKTVKSNNAYNPIKYSEFDVIKLKDIIKDINKQIEDGFKLILLVDSDLIKYDEDNILNLFEWEYHWVVLESPIEEIQNLNANGEIFPTFDFRVYSWGSNPFGKYRFLRKPITAGHFIKNYYGYIKMK
ncbi:MAG: hypothetical protein LBE36_03510 [Flavobacteriaceae bacterium]|jgi:hypothetical protein|nr:hypothetical protein [Flavobacteriaceae bacterium]